MANQCENHMTGSNEWWLYMVLIRDWLCAANMLEDTAGLLYRHNGLGRKTVG